MTNSAAPLAPVFTSSCAILARDFSHSTADVLRDRWTEGKMRHVIAALDGAPVAITTEAMTGSTLIGVRLLSLTNTVLSGACVVVQGEGPAWPRPVAYRLANCGVVLPLSPEGTEAKWTSLNTYREEGTAAGQRARREHPECDYGKWSMTPGQHGVSWRYDPQNGPDGTNEAFNKPGEHVVGKPSSAYGSYSLSELREERDYKGEPYRLAA